MEAVANGDEIAGKFLIAAGASIAYAGRGRVEIAHGRDFDLELDLSAGGEPGWMRSLTTSCWA